MSTTRAGRMYLVNVLLLFAILVFLSAESSARIIHMAVDGDNTTGDGTLSNPFAGLQRCIAAAVPGDTIYVHEGKYVNEPRTGGYTIKGTKGAWILITGAPGEAKPTFAGSETMVIFDHGDNTGDSKFFELRNLIWRKDNPTVGYHNTNIFDGESKLNPVHHMIIDSCEFFNKSTNCEMIKMAGVDTFIIRNSKFNAGNAHCIAIAGVGCHSGEVYNNQIDSCMMGGIEFKGGSSDIAIHNNYIHLTSYPAVHIGGDTWWEYTRPDTSMMENPKFEARRIFVYSNVFVDNNVPLLIDTCRDSKVYNNLIYRTTAARDDVGPTPNYGLVWIMHKSAWCIEPPRNCEISNNVFVFNSRVPWWENVVWRNDIGDEGKYSYTFGIFNNLWYCYEDPSDSEADWTDGGRISPPPATSGNIFGLDPGLYVHPAAQVPLPSNKELLGKKGVAVSHPSQYLFRDYWEVDYTVPPPIGPVNLFPELPSPPTTNNTMKVFPGDIHR